MVDLHVDITSDVICPWCFVGKRRLESAAARADDKYAVATRWLPFELNPDMPVEGVDRAAYMEKKFGLLRVYDMEKRLAEVGAEHGIHFAFDRIRRVPNTRLAHRLIWRAEREGRQDAVVEALFRGWFEEGRDVGDAETLAEIATAAGLPPAALDEALTAETSLHAVRDAEAQSVEKGIQAVPFFVIGQRVSLSGAHPPESFLRAFEEAAAAG